MRAWLRSPAFTAGGGDIGARYALRDYNDPVRSKAVGNLKIAYIPSLDGRRSLRSTSTPSASVQAEVATALWPPDGGGSRSGRPGR